jgi:hypothetical protein
MHRRSLALALALVGILASSSPAQWPSNMYGQTIGNQTFYHGTGSNGRPTSGHSYNVGNQTFYSGFGR